METFVGNGVCGAYAVGKVALPGNPDMEVRREKVEDAEGEITRLERAKEQALQELSEIYEKALKEVGETHAEIFEVHRMLLEDDDYLDAILEMIRKQNVNAEYAVAVAADHFAEMFSSMEDAYMQARAADIRDISHRLIGCLCQKETGVMTWDEPVIICAEDLAPSETVSLDKEKVLAFVTAQGTRNSHTAILARSMNIPAIVGVGEEFVQRVKSGDILAVDGYKGICYVNPDEELVDKFQKRQQEDEEKRKLLLELKGKENRTSDGRTVKIYANVGNVEQIGEVLHNDAGGIGLFRSEFMYIGREDYPTEEELFATYKKVLESMGGKQVIIRTLDIGADKKADYFELPREENPAMGLRGIRLCLAFPDMFCTQLRALYRASVYGKLGIMFPMITNVWEVEEVLRLCGEVKKDLREHGVAYAEDMEVGIMIETPAAALISDELAKMVDFFSVGTNDLIQYTLACDRQNPCVERFGDNSHAAIFRLIQQVAENAHNQGIWIGICGELAADVSLTTRFVDMGIDELSVTPSAVLKVRDVVRKM